MKRINFLHYPFLLILLVGVFSACSSDDKPTVSKTIDSIEVWEGNSHSFDYYNTIKFSYDERKRLIKVETQDDYPELTYTYFDKDSIGYSWYNFTGLSKMNTKLVNGRATTVFSNTLGQLLYSYDNGYLTRAMISENSLVLDYEWEKGNLKSIKGTKFGTSPSGVDPAIYNDLFIVTSILNDYNIDLNILLHFFDERENYQEIMNLFGQAIGMLGKRSVNLLEKVDYSYEYGYDEEGRLNYIATISRVSSDSNVLGYAFKLKYK